LRSLVHWFSPCSAERKSCLPAFRVIEGNERATGRPVWYSVTRSKSYTQPSVPHSGQRVGNFSSVVRYLHSAAGSHSVVQSQIFGLVVGTNTATVLLISVASCAVGSAPRRILLLRDRMGEVAQFRRVYRPIRAMGHPASGAQRRSISIHGVHRRGAHCCG